MIYPKPYSIYSRGTMRPKFPHCALFVAWSLVRELTLAGGSGFGVLAGFAYLPEIAVLR